MRALLAMVTALALVGCAPGEDEELVVSAASSLTGAFADIESAFEKANPGVKVKVNHAGSATLREQILEGAPVDVFAPADLTHIDQVATAGAIGEEHRVFATNTLLIAVPAGNPGDVAGLDDFADPNLLLGLCAEGVPCGDLARAVLDSAGIEPSIDTYEPNARLLLTKIEAGELDAGITYVTDVYRGDSAVEAIELPEDLRLTTQYPIAMLARTDKPELATAFIQFVLSDEGQAILTGFGFGTP